LTLTMSAILFFCDALVQGEAKRNAVNINTMTDTVGWKMESGW